MQICIKLTFFFTVILHIFIETICSVHMEVFKHPTLKLMSNEAWVFILKGSEMFPHPPPLCTKYILDHILPVRKKQLNSGFSGLYSNSCHMLSSDNLLNPYHPFRGHGAARTQPGHFWVKAGYTPDRSPVWATAPACSPKKKNKKKNQTSAVILLVL